MELQDGKRRRRVKEEDMSEIEKPSFIERDFDAVRQRLTADSGLQPADPEYVSLEQIAYEMYILRCNIQDACVQNLLDYARYPMLDYLGAMRDCYREEGESDDVYRERIKRAMDKYAVAGPADGYIELAKEAGGQSEDEDGTLTDNIIDVSVYSPIDVFGDKVRPSGKAVITILSKEYWDIDEKERIEGLIRAAVETSDEESEEDAEEPTDEELSKLAAMKALLERVTNALSDKDKRPLCELVEVNLPKKIDVSFTVEITATMSGSPSLKDDVEAALNNYLKHVKETISRDLVVNQIIGVCQAVPGVYKVEITGLEGDVEAAYNEFISAEAEIVVTGVSNERE